MIRVETLVVWDVTIVIKVILSISQKRNIQTVTLYFTSILWCPLIFTKCDFRGRRELSFSYCVFTSPVVQQCALVSVQDLNFRLGIQTLKTDQIYFFSYLLKISKGLFGVLEFSRKTSERIGRSSKNILFKFEDTKSPFEIIWPLVLVQRDQTTFWVQSTPAFHFKAPIIINVPSYAVCTYQVFKTSAMDCSHKNGKSRCWTNIKLGQFLQYHSHMFCVALPQSFLNGNLLSTLFSEKNSKNIRLSICKHLFE